MLLRLARGSGLDGLAAMAPVTERAGVRLIRPLLPVPRARLRATLRAGARTWIDDPSNDDPAHARIRCAGCCRPLAEAGSSGAAGGDGRAISGAPAPLIDEAVAGIAGGGGRDHPAGYLRLTRPPSPARRRRSACASSARCLMAIGGGGYVPRLDRLERLYGQIAGGASAAGATLGRLSHRSAATAAAADLPRAGGGRSAAVAARPGAPPALGRALCCHSGAPPGARRAISQVGCPRSRRQSQRRWRNVRSAPRARSRRPYGPVLPAIWRAGRSRRELLAVPHLDYWVSDPQVSVSIEFVPPQALAQSRFTVA